MTATEDAYRCAGCGAEIDPNNGRVVDDGIGFFEHFGFVGTDVSLRWASLCCEQDIITPDGRVYCGPTREDYEDG